MRHLLLLLPLLFIFSCSDSTDVAGGTTSLGNGYVSVTTTIDGEGIPAEVILVPADFDPLTDDSTQMLIRFSDSLGSVQFDSLPEEEYSLTAYTDSFGLYVRDITLDSSYEVLLAPLASLVLPVDSFSRVGLKGSPFVGTYDESEGTVTFLGLPSGEYSEVSVDGESVQDSGSVEITAGFKNVYDSSLQVLVLLYEADLPFSAVDDPVTAVEYGSDGLYYGTEASKVWYKGNDGDSQLFPDFPIKGKVTTIRSEMINAKEFLLWVGDSSAQLEGEINYEGPLVDDKVVYTYVDPLGAGFVLVAYDDDAYWTTPGSGIWNSLGKADVTAAYGAVYDTAIAVYLGYGNGEVELLTNDDTVAVVIEGGSGEEIVDFHVFDGKLGMATASGLYQFDSGKIVKIATLPDFSGRPIVRDMDQFWGISGTSDLFCYDKNKGLIIFKDIAGVGTTIYDITIIANTLYLACGDAGIISVHL